MAAHNRAKAQGEVACLRQRRREREQAIEVVSRSSAANTAGSAVSKRATRRAGGAVVDKLDRPGCSRRRRRFAHSLNDTQAATEPAGAQLSPKLSAVMTALRPAPLKQSTMRFEHARASADEIRRRTAEPAPDGIARHAKPARDSLDR